MVIEVSVPPIAAGGPGTLFIIITAIAPAVWAFNTFTANVHDPLLIKAIFPLTAAAFVNPTHPMVGVAEPSDTKTIFDVIGAVIVGPKDKLGKHG
jgi:hypothetical protein